MLADLYLKGDGVSKNCDQARVLLDSAARKGVSGAGERIQTCRPLDASEAGIHLGPQAHFAHE